jgi:hypothetical protein
MIVEVTTTEELKRIFTEALLSKTDKVSKISNTSVLNGIAYGIAKLNQKALKDLSVIESHLFPDSAFGEYLDNLANLNGASARFGASVSTTYLRLVGNAGTFYNKDSVTFQGQGVNFHLVENVTIPQIGYCYAKVVSQTSGAISNVDPLTINKVSPMPSGHNYCINEYIAINGRDFEGDDEYRKRIKEEPNKFSTGTKAFLEQAFRKINPLVLKVYNLGLDSSGDICIGVSKTNGDDFTVPELSELYLKSEKFFSLNELKPDGLDSYGMKIKNMVYFPIDISVRCDIDSAYLLDTIRKEMQINLSKKVDYRNWKDGDVIDWIGLINSIKGVNGVKRVLDNRFFPNNDIIIPRGQLPRFRGFILMNLNGEIISNSSGTLNPAFYPNQSDFNVQYSLLSSL